MYVDYSPRFCESPNIVGTLFLDKCFYLKYYMYQKFNFIIWCDLLISVRVYLYHITKYYVHFIRKDVV